MNETSPHRSNAILTKARILAIGVLAMGIQACTTPEAARFEQWGTMKEALREGRTEGRVALSELEIDDKTYAVGALEGLAGEITIDAGEIMVTECQTPTAIKTTRSSGHRATLLFVGRASKWREHTVDRDVPSAELDAYLGNLVTQAGLDPSRRLPFVIEGPLRALRMHVIAGECPVHARMHDQPLKSPPFLQEADAVSAKIVGIYARDGAGRITHMGSNTHMHVILDVAGKRATGHVETTGLGRGAVVRIPAD